MIQPIRSTTSSPLNYKAILKKNNNKDLSNYSSSSRHLENKDENRKDESGQGKWFALFVIAFVGIVSILRMWNTSQHEDRSPASIKEEKSQELTNAKQRLHSKKKRQ